MSIKEIEKLREKVEKDPNSKLYVPLAEEYRKEGMLDEAIEVLRKGLEKQPGYMSARVLLGKIYLEKGQMNEARAEFESVVKSIPDNLYAHKKLAEIYRDTGEKNLAIKAFRTFLKLNPMDEEALNSLRDIEDTYTEQPVQKLQEHAPPFSEEAGTGKDVLSEAMSIETTSHEQTQDRPLESGQELDAFKKSLFGGAAEPREEIPEELPAVAEDITEVVEIPEDAAEEWSFGEENSPVDEAVAEDITEVEEIPEDTDEEWTFGEENSPADEAVAEDITETEEIPEDADEEWSFGEMTDVQKTEQGEAAEDTKTVSEELFRAEMTPEPGSAISGDNSELLQTANRFISEEKYLGAINVYQQILAMTPDDKQTLQRIEELRSLLKLMGKDKEVLISKLNAFLHAMKKRGDEFHRNS